MDFKTAHNLPFESRPYLIGINEKDKFTPDPDHDWQEFKVGTCHGLYAHYNKAFHIVAIKNEEPGNGHFEDVLQWFEHSCIESNSNLKFCEVWNKEFRQHLILKRSFIDKGGYLVRKYRLLDVYQSPMLFLFVLFIILFLIRVGFTVEAYFNVPQHAIERLLEAANTGVIAVWIKLYVDRYNISIESLNVMTHLRILVLSATNTFKREIEKKDAKIKELENQIEELHKKSN